jgi:hypothetical protein
MEHWLVSNVHWILSTIFYLGVMVGTVIVMRKQIAQLDKSIVELAKTVTKMQLNMIDKETCGDNRDRCGASICGKIDGFISQLSEDRKNHREDVNRVFDAITKNREEVLSAVKDLRNGKSN